MGSVTALFLRGFRFEDLGKQRGKQNLQTPTMEVWLVQTMGYAEKMDAYKAGVAAAGNGHGVYVLRESGKWTWVAGVYRTQAEANDALNQTGLPSTANSALYQIKGKSFPVAGDVLAQGRQVLSAVQNVFTLLLDLRTAIIDKGDTGNLLLDLTAEYNQIKSGAETLQTLNTKLQSPLLATLIYTANQNILNLQEIVYSDANSPCNLATVNTALLNAIFSLDNF